jgi:hypothetical protein
MQSAIEEALNLKTADVLTQRRKDSKTQRVVEADAFTSWMTSKSIPLQSHLPYLGGFASWRLCVNCRIQVEMPIAQLRRFR